MTDKPRLLDAFCGAGGATRGYQRAGFHVTGIDIAPMPRYIGDEFVQGDAIEFIAAHGHGFDAIHASPPCQASSALTKGTNRLTKAHNHIDLIAATRDVLSATNRPYVIENVQGSKVRRDLTLCGEMFGLDVIRHRYFELGDWKMEPPAHVPHRGRVQGWRHGVYYDGPYFAVYGAGGRKGSVIQWQDALGIHWTTDRRELAEALPPIFTEFIGAELMEWIT